MCTRILGSRGKLHVHESNEGGRPCGRADRCVVRREMLLVGVGHRHLSRSLSLAQWREGEYVSVSPLCTAKLKFLHRTIDKEKKGTAQQQHSPALSTQILIVELPIQTPRCNYYYQICAQYYSIICDSFHYRLGEIHNTKLNKKIYY